MNILSLQEVTKSYTNHLAVDSVSFDMPKGGIFGLLGPNGAGKTSLIRIITCITRADTGTILFDGEPLNNNHPSEIGYMPEERGLYKKMKVGEQLTYLALLKGMEKAHAKKEISAWMEKFEIQDWYNRKIEELSKGMQQKIQFIATIIHRPKLLILDEPFSGLDPINSNLIKDEIIKLNQSGISIIFSTHRMEQVEEICQDIVLINKGKKVLSGAVSDIKDNHKENIFRIRFEGAIPGDDFIGREVMSRAESEVVFKAKDLHDANQVLDKMIREGNFIREFKEILPSINDIFIKTVQDNR